MKYSAKLIGSPNNYLMYLEIKYFDINEDRKKKIDKIIKKIKGN